MYESRNGQFYFPLNTNWKTNFADEVKFKKQKSYDFIKFLIFFSAIFILPAIIIYILFWLGVIS